VRDLEAELEYHGNGAPRKVPFVAVEKWREQQPESRWQHVVVRESSRGWLEVDVMICRVQAKMDRRVGDEERLVVMRYVNVKGSCINNVTVSIRAARVIERWKLEKSWPNNRSVTVAALIF
jgi:hypothetical protein